MKVRNEVIHLNRRERAWTAAPGRKVPVREFAALTASIQDLEERQALWTKIGNTYVRVSNDPNVHAPQSNLRPRTVEQRLTLLKAMAAEIALRTGVQYDVPADLIAAPVPSALDLMRRAGIADAALRAADERAVAGQVEDVFAGVDLGLLEGFYSESEAAGATAPTDVS